MKQLSNLFFVAAASLLLASCSNDDLVGTADKGSQAQVTVELSLPQMQTRAYSDGSAATRLQYAVYENNNGTLKQIEAYTSEDVLSGLKKELTFLLVNGHSYNFVFWASTPLEGTEATNPYTVTFSEDGASVEVNYENIKSNNENLDAFYVCLSDVKVNGATKMDAKLQRPFAQINLLTSDYEAAKNVGYEPDLSKVEVANVYKKLDLVSGEATEETKVVYDYAAIDKSGEGLIAGDKPDYQYLNMVYVLANADKENVSVNYSWKQGESGVESTLPLSEVPVQRNHRTNIYGALLTNPIDIYVEILPDFDGDYLLPQETPVAEGLYLDKAKQLFTVTSKEGLKSFAQIAANAKANPSEGLAKDLNITTLQNYTIQLGNDIDLAGETWTPIAKGLYTFNGNGNTISNLKVETENGDFAGLFAGGNGTIKNLVIDGATVKGKTFAGVVAGWGEAMKFENITVKNSYVECAYDENVSGSGENVGAIAGYICSSNTNTGVVNCTVESVVVKGYQFAGGLVGTANFITSDKDKYTAEYKDNTLRNVTIVVPETPSCDEYAVSEVVGRYYNGESYYVISNNVIDDVIIKKYKDGENIVVANSQEALASAIGEVSSGDILFVTEGTYTFPAPSDFSAKDITIECADGVVFEKGLSLPYAKGYGADGLKVKNAYFKNDSGAAVLSSSYFNNNVFEDCVFEGSTYGAQYTYLTNDSEFIRCRFIGNQYHAFHMDDVVGNQGSPTLKFSDCVFDGFVAISGKEILTFTNCQFIQNENSGRVGGNFYSNATFNNCDFYTPDTPTSFHCIYLIFNYNGVHADFEFNNSRNNGETITTDFKFLTTGGSGKVTIDGVEKQY